MELRPIATLIGPILTGTIGMNHGTIGLKNMIKIFLTIFGHLDRLWAKWAGLMGLTLNRLGDFANKDG